MVVCVSVGNTWLMDAFDGNWGHHGGWGVLESGCGRGFWAAHALPFDSSHFRGFCAAHRSMPEVACLIGGNWMCACVLVWTHVCVSSFGLVLVLLVLIVLIVLRQPSPQLPSDASLSRRPTRDFSTVWWGLFYHLQALSLVQDSFQALDSSLVRASKPFPSILWCPA